MLMLFNPHPLNQFAETLNHRRGVTAKPDLDPFRLVAGKRFDRVCPKSFKQSVSHILNALHQRGILG